MSESSSHHDVWCSSILHDLTPFLINFSAVLENLKFFLPSSGPGPITQLAQNGYDMDKLEAVFLSHKHMDHCGDLDTLPPRVPIILGPGALESIGPGYPQDPKSEWKSSWLTDHPVASIPGSAMKSDFELGQATYSSGGEGKKDVFGIKGKKWEKIGCWDHAINWFGDGSFWLIDSPGHCAGHLSALVRVTASPDTCELLLLTYISVQTRENADMEFWVVSFERHPSQW